MVARTSSQRGLVAFRGLRSADRELNYDYWQLLYQEVLVEHRPQELRRKIQAAEAAIDHRL